MQGKSDIIGAIGQVTVNIPILVPCFGLIHLPMGTSYWQRLLGMKQAGILGN